VANAIRQRNVRAKILLRSGYSRELVDQTFLQPGTIEFLEKPSTSDILLERIRTLLDSR